MAAFSLQPSQKEAISKIGQFLDSDKSCFILRGSAGTGKTTLIKFLLNELHATHRSFCLAAPTGRAARILGSKTNQHAETIHSVIYFLSRMEVSEDAQSVNDSGIKLIFPLRTGDPGYSLLILDEASMVGDKEDVQDELRFGSGRLLNDIITFARLDRHEQHQELRMKLLFVGDPAQLPPVGETVSPALSESYLRETYKLSCIEYELTEVMRQRIDSAILECATTIREAINRKNFNVFKCIPKSEEIMATDVTGGIRLVAETHNEKGSSAALITHNNEQARDFNRAVRTLIWGNEEASLQTGDVLLINKNSLGTGLYNGDLVKVVGASDKAECRLIRIRGIAEPVELVFRETMLAFRTHDGKIQKISALIIENLLDSPRRELEPIEQRALLIDFRHRHSKLRPNTAEFNLAIRDDPYFNALHVKYGYALTCHKAQGGEWDTVVVNFGDARGKRNESFFRWAYTAITRAKKQLYTISAPNFDGWSDMAWSNTASYYLNTSLWNVQQSDPTEDPDWNRFSFLVNQKKLFENHLKIRDAWKLVDIDIEQVDHLQYMERYHVTRSGRSATVQYSYKANQQTSKVQKSVLIRDMELANDALEVMEKVLLAPEGSGNLENEFIDDIRRHIEKSIEGSGLQLISVRTMVHRVRMRFKKDEVHAEIDFLHDKTGRVTHAEEVGGYGASYGMIEQLRSLLDG